MKANHIDIMRSFKASFPDKDFVCDGKGNYVNRDGEIDAETNHDFKVFIDGYQACEYDNKDATNLYQGAQERIEALETRLTKISNILSGKTIILGSSDYIRVLNLCCAVEATHANT